MLAGSVGRDFDAVVVEVRRGGERPVRCRPPVLAGCDGRSLGRRSGRLTVADPDTGRVRFAAAPHGNRRGGRLPGPADEPDGQPRRAG